MSKIKGECDILKENTPVAVLIYYLDINSGGNEEPETSKSKYSVRGRYYQVKCRSGELKSSLNPPLLFHASQCAGLRCNKIKLTLGI